MDENILMQSYFVFKEAKKSINYYNFNNRVYSWKPNKINR